MRPSLILLAAAAVAGAASLSGVLPAEAATRKPQKAASVTELVAAVTAAGFGCEDYEPPDEDSTVAIQIGGLPNGESGNCTIDGERSELNVYRTNTDLKRILAAVPSLGCSIGEAFGTTQFRYVVGDNWTIDTPSSATTKPLAKALRAKQFVYKCKK